MGREIRKVIPNWDHPKEKKISFRGSITMEYVPLHNESYTHALNKWIAEHKQWELGEHEDQKSGIAGDTQYYADWGGDAPRLGDYRPDWKPEEMTWFQVYETVSEGTPVTPPFATQQELVEYMVENGDFWDQDRRNNPSPIFSSMPCAPWSRKSAESFVFGSGWAPSFVVTLGEVKSGVEALAEDVK